MHGTLAFEPRVVNEPNLFVIASGEVVTDVRRSAVGCWRGTVHCATIYCRRERGDRVEPTASDVLCRHDE